VRIIIKLGLLVDRIVESDSESLDLMSGLLVGLKDGSFDNIGSVLGRKIGFVLSLGDSDLDCDGNTVNSSILGVTVEEIVSILVGSLNDGSIDVVGTLVGSEVGRLLMLGESDMI